jgi:dTDP-4-dehydrorhamnose reductase
MINTNIRTSIIGEEIYNKKSLLEWIISNKGNVINGYVNHSWNGITCLELAKQVDDIISNSNYWTGVRHMFSPDTVNKYELSNMINDIYDLKITINKFNTENNCYRNLNTVYTDFVKLPLYDQIKELKNYKLNE